MKKHLTTIMALATALSLPLSAMAQDAVDAGSSAASDASAAASEVNSNDSQVSSEANAEDSSAAQPVTISVATPEPPKMSDSSNKKTAAAADASDSAKDKAAEEAEDDKSWTVGAAATFDLGLGAFTYDEYARKIRSRFTFAINGGYTIPVIDVDIHAETGFSQWMSKAGGSNGQYEFRWADSTIGLSRNIWGYNNKKSKFAVSFDADLSFTLPTSKASINSKLYTTIAPTLSASIKLDKFSFGYSITYGHSFNKYTSVTMDPSDVDVLSRSTGTELVGSHDIAIDGVLTEIELANQFTLGYKFLDCLGLTVGFGFADAWTYDNGTITKDDEYVGLYAKVGRGHSQFSLGTVSLGYQPHKWVGLSLTMASMQPWKTADNKTLRFPWFDTVSPSKNYTKFIFGVTFQY